MSYVTIMVVMQLGLLICAYFASAIIASTATVIKTIENQTLVQEDKLDYIDCGSDPNRPVRILDVTASPLPLLAPGKFRFGFSLNVTETLPPKMAIHVSVSKKIGPFSFKVPCTNNFGTCVYSDACALLNAYFGHLRRCPRWLRRHGIPCRCPIEPGIYTLPRLSSHIPRIKKVWGLMVEGEYDVMLRVYNTANKDELACFQSTIGLKWIEKKKTEEEEQTKKKKAEEKEEKTRRKKKRRKKKKSRSLRKSA